MSETTNSGDQSPEEVAAAAAAEAARAAEAERIRLAREAQAAVPPEGADIDPGTGQPGRTSPPASGEAGEGTPTPKPPETPPADSGKDADDAAAEKAEKFAAFFRKLAQYLSDIGMDSLFSVAPDGTLSGKLWDWVQSGLVTTDTDVLDTLVEATPEFALRFPAIAAQRAQVKAGKNVHVMTAAEVLEYERTVKGYMYNAGMMDGFYGTNHQIQQLAALDLSAEEVKARIQEGWSMIHNAPSAIRDKYYAYYGVQGDAALAAYYLNFDHTFDLLDRQTHAAGIGGIGSDFNINLSRQQAEDLARYNVSNSQATQGFAEIDRERALFEEQIHETENLTAEETGVASTFGTVGSSSASAALRQRMDERRSAFAPQGGAAQNQSGVFGLSEANQ